MFWLRSGRVVRLRRGRRRARCGRGRSDPAGRTTGTGTRVVAFLDLAAEPVGGLVGVHADLLGQVDHRGHRDGGAGGQVGQPLLHGRQRPRAEPGTARHVSDAGLARCREPLDGVGVQVHVDRRRRPCRPVRRRGRSAGTEPSAASSAVACRSRAYCGSASTPTAFARRTCSGSLVTQRLQGAGDLVQRGVERRARPGCRSPRGSR